MEVDTKPGPLSQFKSNHYILQENSLPSSVDFCNTAHLTDITCTNLILIKNYLLEVYILKQDEKHPLHLYLQHRLWGTVTNMSVGRLPKHERDILILTFSFAKLSILYFNIKKNEFENIGLYIYEKVPEPFFDTSFVSSLSMDPQYRGWCFHHHPYQLTIFPVIDADSQQIIMGTSDNIIVPCPGLARSFTIDLLTLEIDNIKDIVFLNGYFEPTLAILFENKPTWTGRYPIRQFSSSIIVISLNFAQKTHNIISQIDNLPHSCFQLIPVPSSFSGFLIISNNLIFHYHQGLKYVLSLNKYGDEEGIQYGSIPSENVVDNLHNSFFLFLSDQYLICLTNDGNLYTLKLLVQGQIISSLVFSSLFHTTQPSCLCLLDKNLFFIGSIRSDSFLIEFSVIEDDIQIDEFQNKRIKIEENDEFTDLFVSLNSNEASSGKIQLIIRDCLFNMGNLKLQTVAPLTPELSQAKDQYLTHVCCSGFDQFGCLLAIERGIRSDILENIPFSTDLNIRSMWIISRNISNNLFEEKIEKDAFDDYLFVSTLNKTRVYHTMPEIVEIDLFEEKFTFEAILTVANFQQQIIVINSKNLFILNDLHIIREISLPVSMKDVSIMSPYIVFLSENDELYWIYIKGDGISLFRLISIIDNQFSEISLISLPIDSFCTAFNLYHDKGSIIFTSSVSNIAPIQPSSNIIETNADEEFLAEILFGDSSPQSQSIPSTSQPLREQDILVVVFKDGRFQLYSLQYPDVTLIFSSTGLSIGATYLSPQNDSLFSSEFQIIEIGLYEIHQLSYPFLLAILSNGDLLVYESYPGNDDNENIRLLFKRFPLSFQSRPLISKSLPLMGKRFHPFSNISNLQGIFIGGCHPIWVFGERGYFRWHAMSSSHQVVCFCSFNTSYCPNGFVYFDNESNLRVGTLFGPKQMIYDSPFPFRKIPLKATPHHLIYHPKIGSFFVSVSRPLEIASIEEDINRKLPITTPQYELRVYTAYHWLCQTTWDNFDLFESVSSLNDVRLLEGHNLWHFIALGTGVTQAEEISCRGRILLFDIYRTNIVQEDGFGQKAGTTHSQKLQLVYDRKEKGPITSIECINGVLLLCIGQRIILYRWDGSDLIGCAFFDAQYYIVSCRVIQNYIIIGDILKGPYLKLLSLLGSNMEPCKVLDCEYLVDDQSLSIVVTSDEHYLSVLHFSPYNTDNLSSKVLKSVADIFVGTSLTSLKNLRMQNLHDPMQSTKQYFISAVGLDGTIVSLVPLESRIFRRLYSLCLQINFSLSHIAGLNPRAYRIFHSIRNSHLSNHKNIVDGALLNRYLTLDLEQQQNLAANIGTTPAVILDNILEINLASSFI